MRSICCSQGDENVPADYPTGPAADTSADESHSSAAPWMPTGRRRTFSPTLAVNAHDAPPLGHWRDVSELQGDHRQGGGAKVLATDCGRCDCPSNVATVSAPSGVVRDEAGNGASGGSDHNAAVTEAAVTADCADISRCTTSKAPALMSGIWGPT
jgi:hypothetical protein